MTRIPMLAVAFALGLSLSGCDDARRETVRDWLQSHPPDGFQVVAVPEKFTINDASGGAGETVVPMRYRLIRPTVETRDLFALPRGLALAKRLSEVRGWALATLPAGDPTRKAIIAGSAAARAAFPTKRVVTPKDTEIESTVVVTLGKESGAWQVKSPPPSVDVPGLPDLDPRIPFEDSPAVAEKFDELETAAIRLEESRRKYLADRALAAARSLQTLRSRLQTGFKFESRLPDGTPVRLVISRGADSGKSIVAVLTVQRGDLSSARYAGGMAQEPSGQAVWRAAQVSALSGAGGEPLTDARFHPILTLTASEKGLHAQIRTASSPAVSLEFSKIGTADLIPDE